MPSVASGPRAYLWVTSDSGSLRIIPLNERINIHRSAKDYGVLAEALGKETPLEIQDALVSRKHAVFFWDNGALWVRDLGSRNGTDKDGTMLPGWQPGQASQPVRLAEGDKVYLGNRVMVGVEFTSGRITVRPGDLVQVTAETAEELRSRGFAGLERDGGFNWVRGRNRDAGTYRIHAAGREVDLIVIQEKDRGVNEIKREIASMVHRDIKEGPSIATTKDPAVQRSNILSQLPGYVDAREAVTIIDKAVHRSETGSPSDRQASDVLKAIRDRMKAPAR